MLHSVVSARNNSVQLDTYSRHQNGWQSNYTLTTTKLIRPPQLSQEAQIAMAQLARKPRESNSKTSEVEETKVQPDNNVRVEHARCKTEHVATVKLSDVYNRSRPQRLDGDITDSNKQENKKQTGKFVLGGGKLQNAMEIVEIVNADESHSCKLQNTVDDDQIIAEIARINSIEKCNVWFEAHDTLVPAMNSQSNSIDCE